MAFFILSKDGCKYCDMAVSLLTAHAKVFEMYKCKDGVELRKILSEDYGMVSENVTFPQIFRDGKHNKRPKNTKVFPKGASIVSSRV